MREQRVYPFQPRARPELFKQRARLERRAGGVIGTSLPFEPFGELTLCHRLLEWSAERAEPGDRRLEARFDAIVVAAERRQTGVQPRDLSAQLTTDQPGS